MLQVNFNQDFINKMRSQYKGIISNQQIINLYNEYMDGMDSNNWKHTEELKKLRNNIISGLIVIGVNQEIIPYCMYELDLEDLLNKWTVKQINKNIVAEYEQ